MSYTVKYYPDQAAILFKLHADYLDVEEGPQADTQIKALLDSAPEPVILIYDCTDFKFTFDGMMNSVNRATTQSHLLSHPKINKLISVVADDLMKMATKGMENPLFGIGQGKVEILGSLDAALERARALRTGARQKAE